VVRAVVAGLLTRGVLLAALGLAARLRLSIVLLAAGLLWIAGLLAGLRLATALLLALVLLTAGFGLGRLATVLRVRLCAAARARRARLLHRPILGLLALAGLVLRLIALGGAALRGRGVAPLGLAAFLVGL